ncbi:MAG: hypothetical protein ACP5GF_12260 [Thiomonas sp.]
MKIDDNLNLVIPAGENLRAFSTPVSDLVFEANYRVLSEAQEQIFGRGMKAALMTGPRIAALAIADAGKRIAAELGEDGDMGASAFRAEIRRLTTILAPGAHGWDMLPVDAAIQNNVLNDADWKEVEGLLCFFTCAWFMESRKTRKAFLEALAGPLNCLATSQNCADFTASLPMPKADAKQPTKKAASSVPV